MNNQQTPIFLGFQKRRRRYIAVCAALAVLAAGLARCLPLEQPVSAYLAEQVGWFAELEFSRALFVSAGAAWGLWLIFVGLSVAALKKSSRKMDQRRV